MMTMLLKVLLSLSLDLQGMFGVNKEWMEDKKQYIEVLYTN